VASLKFLFKPLLLQHERYHLCHRCPQCWQHLGISSHFCRHLVSNVYVGIFITLLIIPFHNSQLIRTLEDISIDWVISMYRNTTLTKPKVPPFVFMDIDEQTYRLWKELLPTPRDKLRDLIQFAVAGQPKLVIIDVDLTYPTDRYHTQLTPADVTLKDYLATYESQHCTNQPCPHLILVSTSRPTLDAQGHFLPTRELRPSFLGVTESPHLHWASALFEPDVDFMIRRWRLCDKVSHPKEEPILSIQLLTAKLSGTTELKCPEETAHAAIGQRIIYKLLPNTAMPKPEKYPDTQSGQPILTTWSAHRLLQHPAGDKSFLTDRIVVIGGSYLDSGDWYATPIGAMPGAVIIINSILSLQQYGELHKPNILLILLTEIILIVIMSLAFACFTSFYGMLFSGLLIILVMMPISFWLFQAGIWLDFAIPLLAVQLHRMAAVLHQ
jgi:CHASE2 domain-containing sensor protein